MTINVAILCDTVVMAMPRAELIQMVKAAKIVCVRAQPKRLFLYFGLDTLRKGGLRCTLHEPIRFEESLRIVKRVLPAVQQLIRGLAAGFLPPSHPIFPAGLASTHQIIRRLYSI